MRVHLVDQDGNEQTIEAKYIREGNHGLYLMENTSKKVGSTSGYVPYERLSYVEGVEEEE